MGVGLDIGQARQGDAEHSARRQKLSMAAVTRRKLNSDITVPKHVAFLRAINVRGHNQVRMVDLQTLIVSVGATGVRTVIQSGNVVSEAAARRAPAIVREVRARLDRKGSGA